MLLEVENLCVHYHQASTDQPVRALDGVSLRLEAGETLGIIGETGSGKSTFALTLMGLVKNADIRGVVRFQSAGPAGLIPLPIREEAAMRRFRWRRIALAFQGASTAF